MKLQRATIIDLAKDEQFCSDLANELEIQADGGDDAGEYVSFALTEVNRKKRLYYHQRRIDEINEK